MSPEPSNRERAADLHRRLGLAVREYRTTESQLARLIHEMKALRLFRCLGYSCLGAYAQRELAMHPKKAHDLASIGGRLDALPALERAFQAGEIGWTKAREIIKVATPETEESWVERAAETTSRELETQVRSALRGDEPIEDPDPPKRPARVQMVFELEAADAVVLRDALGLFHSLEYDAKIADGAVLADLARRYILDAEPGDAPTGERYLVVTRKCPSCREQTGPDFELGDTVACEIDCDHVGVDLSDSHDHRGAISRRIPATVRRAVLFRDDRSCIVPDCTCRLWLDLHHLAAFAKGGDNSEGNLVTLCGVHHRLVHEGVLAIHREDTETVRIAFASGREFRVPIPQSPFRGRRRKASSSNRAFESPVLTSPTPGSSGSAPEDHSPTGRSPPL